ncbi:J domain-containing protein [Halorubellus sp. JP-L1]|nr:J domain-containing protein [Halorubellus sp. JP-L1]NHN41474.1 J domain-containing protein [Halorubellus sp. JP-L1]
MLAVVAIVTREAFVLAIALPFAATGYFMWYQATGRMRERVAEGVNADGSRFAEQKAREGAQRGRSRFAREARRRIDRERRRRARASGRRARTSTAGGAGAGAARGASRRGGDRGRRVAQRDGPSLEEAYHRLGLDPGASEEAVREAYRERVKDVHPDTADGDEEAFKRVTAAYERLTGE